MRTILFLCSAMLLAAACSKKTSTPANTATQNGSNCMYYEAEGVQHDIKGSGGMLSQQGVQVSVYDGNTFISSYNRNGFIYDDLHLTIPTGHDVQLNTPYHPDTAFQRSYYKLQEQYYYPSYSESYVIFTRYDDQVIAGTFHFRALPDSTHPGITLHKGWFDIGRGSN